MLRSVDDGDGGHFAFGASVAAHRAPGGGISSGAIAIDHGPDGPTATIPDAHFLFTAEFARAGVDLVLRGEDAKTLIVHDYFASDARARLLSPEGAALSGDVVSALAGPLAPGQYAQGAAATAPAGVQTVGRVAQASADATIVRNGVAIAAHAGDAIHKGDVLQTVSGEFGVTFNDGSTLNLTANSRLVVNEFVYSPNNANNSQLLNLVQGSLTFISGEVAHTGTMNIGTPVATMGIRGTVGGVTTANDGTVNFYVSQSATGAVILDSRGTIIANVVQDGPMIVVRPVGPLQVVADEVQKSPAQLAIELQALQHIVSIQSIGQQILQQFFQQDPNNSPNPQSTGTPHTQFQIDLHTNPSPENSGNNIQIPDSGTITITPAPLPPLPDAPQQQYLPPVVIQVPIPPNLAPINFGPLQQTVGTGGGLEFSTARANAISVFDADSAILNVTLTASHGVVTLAGIAGLTFTNGDGASDATMTFSGTQVAINAALDGLKFTPSDGYTGAASVQIVSSDGNSTTATETIAITVDNFVHWNSASGGDWFEDASNWTSQPHIPGTGDSHDDIAITMPVGGTVTLNQDSSIHDLKVGAGVSLEVKGSPDVGIQEEYEVQSGSLDVAGRAANAGTIEGSGGRINFYGDVSNTGTIAALDGGEVYFRGNVIGSGTFTSRDDGYLYFAGAFAGVVLLNGGDARFGAAVAGDAAVTFTSSGSALYLDDASTFGGHIAGFSLGNFLDFAGFGGVEAGSVSLFYDLEPGEVVVSHAAGSESPPDVVIRVGVSSDNLPPDLALSSQDFVLLHDGQGGYNLAFNEFWIGGDGTAIDDSGSWSLGVVPDQSMAVTFDSVANLDLGGHDAVIAGLVLGIHANLSIVDGTFEIGALENSGSLTIDGADGTTLYVSDSFENVGIFEANDGAAIYAYTDVTNDAGGTFNVLNGATFYTSGVFNNYGTALVDPPTAVTTKLTIDGELNNVGEVASLTVRGMGSLIDVVGGVYNSGAIEAGPGGTFHAGGHVEGSGQFLISGGTMEFDGAVACNVTVSFDSCTSDTLILDHSPGFAGTLSNFGIGDRIVDHDGEIDVGSFCFRNVQGVETLHYTENGQDVSLALSGNYSSGNFAVSYSDGGIDISFNQPPVVTPAPGPLAVNEDTPLTLDGAAAISVADLDTGELTITLAADHGAISLNQLAGLAFTDGDGAADASMTFSGTKAAINAALDGLTFAPAADYNGDAAVTVTANDGIANPVTQVVDIAVNPVNDAPVIRSVESTGGLLSTGLTALAASYLVASHDLINGLGGDAGFGATAVFYEQYSEGQGSARSDDGSTAAVDIRSVFGDSGLNFFGTNYTELYINNNGNITFGNSNGDYTPSAIGAHFAYPIIAPFWADVDTLGGAAIASVGGHSMGSNLVYYDLDAANHVMTITWDDVGYFSQNTNALNAFQLQLIGAGDGNFDIVFRYESINWTAGDASGGHGGLGGITAQAGYSDGLGNSVELPGSGIESNMLALPSTAGNTGIAGVDVFQVESGNVTAASAASGLVGFTDPDASDTHVASVQANENGNGTGYLGTFTLDDHAVEANGAGSVGWHFSLTTEESNSIISQGAATQSYDITIADNNNSAVTQTVSLSFGGQQADTFHFINADTHLGADTILNFDVAHDTIQLDGYNAIANNGQLIAALSFNGADAQHGDAVINLGHGDSVTIAGVTQAYVQLHLDLVHFNSALA